MSEIEIFVQGEGIPDIVIVRVPRNAMVREVMEAAKEHGLQATDEEAVFLEDSETPIGLDTPLEETGIRHRGRIHIHRCRRVAVSVNFNARQEEKIFPPSATIQRVKKWAVHEFKLADVDAAEHVLQVCNSSTRPDEDTHIGVLVHSPHCTLCFDLVPKQRVEG